MTLRNHFARNARFQDIALRKLTAEKRLLLACLLNALLFAITQIIVLFAFSNANNKWLNWLLLVIFMTNSYGNPISVLVLSSAVRSEVRTFFKATLAASKKLPTICHE